MKAYSAPQGGSGLTSRRPRVREVPYNPTQLADLVARPGKLSPVTALP